MQGFFVTGTDTGVGKTEVACAIAKKYPKSVVRKPVESGCLSKEGVLFPKDASLLKQAAGSSESLDKICPFRFKAAISPESAAISKNQKICLEDLVSACVNNNFTIVEGAGGWLSPIALNATNADLAVELDLPVVLVVANRLGCINHTLLTINSILQHQLKLAKIVLVNVKNNNEDYFADLSRWTDLPIQRIKHYSCPAPWTKFEFD